MDNLNNIKLSRINDDGTFTNPFIWADIPDPDIIRVGDTYYMTSTTMYFTPGCPVMKSKDLVNWEIINYVYDTLDDSDCMTLQNGKHDYGRGSWASCLRYYNGKYYVTFSAANTGKTFTFTSDDIEKGNWKRHSIDGVYHDMSVLFDDDGRVYMVHGCREIKVTELTSDAAAVKENGMNKTIIENADISGGKSLAEGSHIYKINGKYYIFIIAWPKTGTGRRIQVCYRADRIDGQYEGKIVLDDDLGFNNAGVAQGGIVDTPDGKWYSLLFQDHGAVGRIPVLVPVRWENDFPIFGENGKARITLPLPRKISQDDKAEKIDIGSIIKSDDFENETLALAWQWNHNPDNNCRSLTERAGWLRLKTGSVSKCLSDARNTLTQRTFGSRCSGSTLIDVSKIKNGDYTGLAALQDYYAFVGVKMIDDKKYIVMSQAPQTSDQWNYQTGVPENEIEVIPLNQNLIYLKIDFDFSDTFSGAKDEAEFFYSLCGSKWTRIGGKLKMSYRLSHFTGYRFALFNFSVKNTGGYADFDWFKVTN